MSETAQHTFFLKRVAVFDFSVRIWDLGPGSTSEGLITNSGVSKDQAIQRPADMYLQSVKGGYLLWDGPGPVDAPDSSTKLIEIKSEGWRNTTSVYTECIGEKRMTQMHKPGKGVGSVSWWSTARMMVDFDGTPYKWQSSFLDDLTCTREDGVVVAEFDRAKVKIADVGMLSIKTPMDKAMQRLVIATCFIKWREDRKRD